MKKILCLLFFCFVISITSNSSAKTFYTGDQVKDFVILLVYIFLNLKYKNSYEKNNKQSK